MIIIYFQVNKTLQLSPGKTTRQFAEAQDRVSAKRKLKMALPATKRRRLILKALKSKSTVAHETREGEQYCSNICLEKGTYMFLCYFFFFFWGGGLFPWEVFCMWLMYQSLIRDAFPKALKIINGPLPREDTATQFKWDCS